MGGLPLPDPPPHHPAPFPGSPPPRPLRRSWCSSPSLWPLSFVLLPSSFPGFPAPALLVIKNVVTSTSSFPPSSPASTLIHTSCFFLARFIPVLSSCSSVRSPALRVLNAGPVGGLSVCCCRVAFTISPSQAIPHSFSFSFSSFCSRSSFSLLQSPLFSPFVMPTAGALLTDRARARRVAFLQSPKLQRTYRPFSLPSFASLSSVSAKSVLSMR